jgi:phospholipase D1/2
MGGLDLCFGRWDTMTHPVADAHPGNLDDIVFPGQDFNNARVFDFEGVNNWNHNQLDRTKSSRMGWSDITISLNGPIVDNLLTHFVDRWNYIYGEKYTRKDKGKYQAIAESAPSNSHNYQIPDRHQLLDNMQDRLNRGYKRFMAGEGIGLGGEREGGHGGHHGASIQLCRSCCEWSSGHPTEHSIANAYMEAISNAQHFVYIENQFFITATHPDQRPVSNKIGASIVSRIVRAHRNGENFRIVVIMPAVPAFAGDLKSDGALGTRAIMEFQYNSISRGGHSIIESLQQQGVQEWWRYIGFYNLRNYDRINISSAMRQAERESGVSYEDARRGHDQRYASEGHGYGNEQYDRYQSAASNVSDRTWDTVSSCYMEGGPDIRSVPWQGSPEAEMDAFVSEELYVHSKVLIADDRLVICGSANINDRSQLGNHDSEIAVVIEDQESVQSTMDGRPYTASKFAASLRRQLFRKHLGLIPDQRWDQPTAAWTPLDRNPQDYDWGSRGDRMVEDPVGPEFLRLWADTARTNTEVFSKVFHPVPNDAVRNWEQYDDYFGRHFVIPGGDDKGGDKNNNGGRVEYGHVVRSEFPGGVAEVKDWLSRVRGTLVDMPLQFLVELGEDLAMEGVGLNFATKELYT